MGTDLNVNVRIICTRICVKAVGIADYYDDKPYHYNQEADGHFASDYATLSEAHEGGRLLNQEIMAESITMLKNEGGTLPLNNDVKNISVFGKHSTDFAHIVRANPFKQWIPKLPV